MKAKIQKTTISKAAEASDTTIETIRFYERKGLIQKPKKGNGFLHYSDDEIKSLRFIKKAKTLGFTLQEIKELMDLEVCSKKTSKIIREKSNAKIEEIENRISDLTIILKTLKKFSKSCASGKKSSTKECGLLECFENNWECC